MTLEALARTIATAHRGARSAVRISDRTAARDVVKALAAAIRSDAGGWGSAATPYFVAAWLEGIASSSPGRGEPPEQPTP